ncbi:MAG TPA: hypothetical protein PLN52_21175 [Opitutaceae bacterium]|nr:hypothetical protein [Opitutaceae bacterium]
MLGELSSFDNAQAVILLGAVGDLRIAGGSLFQNNGKAVKVSGMTKVTFTAGTTSQGTFLPAQPNRARLELNGIDVTDQLVKP